MTDDHISEGQWPQWRAPRIEGGLSRLAYRIDEAAVALRVTPSTLYRWIAAGKLKTIKIGGRRLVSAKVIHALIEKS